MVSSIRINCTDSTYVEKNNPSKSYTKEEKLLTGITYATPSDFNIFKTLLKFDTSKLNNHTIKSAFLYLFVEEIQFTNTKSYNTIISKNLTNTNLLTINWVNYPKTLPINKYTFNISKKNVGKYVKLNITELIDSWVKENMNYGLTLEPLDMNQSSLVKFSSHNSLKPPYLLLTAICNSSDTEYDPDFSMVYCFSTSQNSTDTLTTTEQ